MNIRQVHTCMTCSVDPLNMPGIMDSRMDRCQRSCDCCDGVVRGQSKRPMLQLSQGSHKYSFQSTSKLYFLPQLSHTCMIYAQYSMKYSNSTLSIYVQYRCTSAITAQRTACMPSLWHMWKALKWISTSSK